METKNPRNVPAELVYEGEIIHAKSEMLSLTDMWKAAGADPSKAPAQWQRLPATVEFVEHLGLIVGKSHDNLVETRKRGGTFAHWQIALAYAKYLSPAFHVWCNTVVRERMEGKSVSVASLPPEILDLIKRTDGIARQLSHKVTEIEKALPTLMNHEAAIPALVSRQVEAALLQDARRAVLNVVSVRQLTEDGGAIAKGRNSVNRKIGYALRDLAAADPDGGKAFRCPHTGVWLFDRVFAEAFMRNHGAAMIRAHNDKHRGQCVLKLVQPKKQNASLTSAPTNKHKAETA